MKKTELKTLRGKKIEELKKLSKERKLEIVKVLAKMAAGQEKNLKKAKNLKKNLAQTETIIREMEIVNKLQKEAEVENVEKELKTKKTKNHGPERLKGVEG